MKKHHVILAIAALPIFLGLVWASFSRSGTMTVFGRQADTVQAEPVVTVPPEVEEPAPETAGQVAGVTDIAAETEARLFAMPIVAAADRITKKPFGIEIHPETSPVPGDRFDGFHVGVDFETFEDEQEADVAIFAICQGPLRFKKHATGYGGVAVQTCRIDDEDVSVIYGHLDVASVVPEAGDELVPGQRIGNLGKGHSPETDGVRKHLHLGIRKGLTNDIRGYVQDPAEETGFLDPREVLGL